MNQHNVSGYKIYILKARQLNTVKFNVSSYSCYSTKVFITDTHGSLSELRGGAVSGSEMAASRASLFSTSALTQSSRGQLMQAREILELGLKNVSQARQAVALTDGKSIADVSWAQVFINYGAVI